MNQRPIIYQLFPRILTNTNTTCKPWGTLLENGSGTFNGINDKTLKSIKGLGVTHLWFTGVIEMATKTIFPGIRPDNPNVVKGEAGSPYAIKDYYDVSPALAENVEERMQEFEALLRRTHDNGLKVLLDFVPNHTARAYHSDVSPIGIEDFGSADNTSMFFSPSNNYYYITNQQFSPDFDLGAEGDTPYVEFPAKATGNDCYTAFCTRNDWYETVKLNYGFDPWANKGNYDPVPDTWNRMLHILRYWAAKGVDGFRCDMVFMVPLEFWHWAIPQVKETYPDVIFIGEIYDVNLYRPFLDYGCFDYLYDKVNLYDTLVAIKKYNHSAAQLTGCWQTVDGIEGKMLNFLENHDEVRFASKSFAGSAEYTVPYLVTSALMSCGPYMIYYGQELGEAATENEGFAGFNDRTTIFDYWSYDTIRRWYNFGMPGISHLTAHEKWLRDLYKKVLTMCNKNRAMREGKFFDLMYVNLKNPYLNPHNIYAFVRYCDREAYLVVANFAGEAQDIKINIPELCYDMAGLEEAEFDEKDLLWGEMMQYKLRRGEPISIHVNASDALILPLKKVRQTKKGKTSKQEGVSDNSRTETKKDLQ